MPFGETLQILSTVLVAGGLAVWASIATQKWHSKSKQAVSIPRSAGEPVFLFDRETLIDATPTALDLVRRRKSDASEVDGLIHVLQPMFPSLRSDISRSNGDQKKTITSPVDETLSVGLEREGNKLRITLKNSEYLDAALRYKALEAEAYEKGLSALC